ncbi:MAG: DUF2062 domain-containing protein [Candidatus Woesearchaeota archaeon]
MIGKYKNKIKKHFQAVIRTKKSPHSIALGFAIGTLIGILPTPGFNILLGVLVVLIFRKVSKFSLFGALAFWNPIVLIPLYFWSYKIGGLIFGSAPVVEYELTILEQIYHFSRRFLVGSIILAPCFSILSYFLMRKIIVLITKSKK